MGVRDIVINFKDGTQAITDSWGTAYNYYNSIKKEILTIFIGDDLVFSVVDKIDTFLHYTPPVVRMNSKVGIKFNEGKPKMSILFKQFPKALEAVVRCAEYGHNKYNIDGCDEDHLNFKRVLGGPQVYEDAGYRHLMKQGIDEESGLPHLHHAVWNFLAMLEITLDGQNN